MGEVVAELAALDKLVHEPARLAIMSALSACRRGDFLYLQRLTGLTKGNLSSHLTKLEEAGLVEIETSFVEKKPNMMVGLTRSGRGAIERYWKQLETLRDEARSWEPQR